MAWQTDLMNELLAMVETVWPSVETIYRGREAGFINWRTSIERFYAGSPDGASYPPFAVIQWGQMTPSQSFGDVNSAYEVSVSVYFVTASVADDGFAQSADDLQNQIMNQLELMRAAFHADGVLWQSVTDPVLDMSEQMEANKFFTEAMIPMQAGVCRATIIAGVTP